MQSSVFIKVAVSNSSLGQNVQLNKFLTQQNISSVLLQGMQYGIYVAYGDISAFVQFVGNNVTDSVFTCKSLGIANYKLKD